MLFISISIILYTTNLYESRMVEGHSENSSETENVTVMTLCAKPLLVSRPYVD